MKTIALFDEVTAAFQGFEFDLPTLLDNYRVDEPPLPLLIEQLKLTPDICKTGLFLHDTAGIASHLLGLYYCKHWKNNKLFTQYKHVIWLPFAKLLSIPIKPTHNRETSLTQLGKLQSSEFQLIENKTLVIITGIDYQNAKQHDDHEFMNYAAQWMQHIKDMPFLAIGNYIPTFFSEFKTVDITLPSIYLNLSYEKEDDYPNNDEHVSFPGKLLVSEIRDNTQRIFRFNQQNPDGVFSITKNTVLNYMKGEVDIITEQKENVEHMQPLLTVQDVIKILAGQTSSSPLGEPALAVLDSPAKWYYAALSAEKVHENLPKNTNKKFFLYLIAGHIVVRRMSEDSRNYMTDLGSAENYSICSIKHDEKFDTPEIKFILAFIIGQPNFNDLDSKTMILALLNAKKAWVTYATQQRNSSLEKKIPLKPVLLDDKTKQIFKNIYSVFNSDFNDIEIKKSLKDLSEKEQDASYQTIQAGINQCLQSGESEVMIRNQIVKIINNEVVDEKFNKLVLMLAANLLAESARNLHTFFAPFAMLMLSSFNKRSWNRFSALSERAQMNIDGAAWDQLILADCMDAIGGIHPMAHNGSFIQSNPTYNTYAKSPKYGIAWPELKTQLLYAKWLAESIKFSKIGIHVKDYSMSFSPKTEYFLLSEKEKRFIVRDFELLRRIELSYTLKPDSQDFLVSEDKPFKNPTNLIADPKQIKYVPCGMKGEFGYYLQFPKQIQDGIEDYFIHLTPYDTYMIALKLAAIGKEKSALPLYDYLCGRHPINILFRFSKLKLLVFHYDLMKDKEIRSDAQYNLDFFERNDLQVDPELQPQIDYLSAVYSLRVTIEEPRINLACIVSPKVAMSFFYGAAKKAEESLKKFYKHDEERPILQLLIGIAYQRACSYLINNKDLLQGETGLVIPAADSKEQSSAYLISYALTLHHTANLYVLQNLKNAFDDLIEQDFNIKISALAFQDKSKWKKHAAISQDIQNNVKMFVKILVSWISEFREHMLTKKKYLNENKRKKYPPSPKGMLNPKIALEIFLQDDVQTKIILENDSYALLIKSNWEIPHSITQAWVKFHHLSAEPATDSDFGPCLKIKLNFMLASREHFQPTPHPNSFLVVKNDFVQPIEESQFFDNFSLMFNECLEQIKAWDMTLEKKVSYHLYGDKTALPTLHMTKQNGRQNVIIELPNAIPIRLVLDWLRKYNFAFHWINDETLGRCLYLPQINICKNRSEYNAAISNGDIILPFLKQAPSPLPVQQVVSSEQSTLFSNTPDKDQNSKAPVAKTLRELHLQPKI